MVVDMVVVVIIGFLIEEFFVNGKEILCVLIKSQKCIWNIIDLYLGMIYLYILLKFRIVFLVYI